MASPLPDLTAALVRDPLVVTPATILAEVIALMANAQPQPGDIDVGRCSCVVVVADGRVVGLLTERDMVRLMAQSTSEGELFVGEEIDSPVSTLKVSDLADGPWVQLQLQRCRHPLPVLDQDGDLVGLLTAESLDAAQDQFQNDLDQNPSVNTPLGGQSCPRLVMSAPVGIFRHDADDNCIYVNDCYGQITGLTPETAMGEQWQAQLHPQDRDLVVAAWAQFVATQRAFNLEYRFQWADGTVKWVYAQASVEQDPQGQVIGYIGTITDITDLKQAEIVLANRETQHRAMLAAIPDLLLRVGGDGVYRGYVSPNRDLAIVPVESDLVGQSIHDVLPAELADQQLQAVHIAIQTGELQRYEQQLQVESRLQDEEVLVIKNGDDEALLIIRDITERAQLEAERKRAEVKRQQMEAALIQSEARNRAIIAALPDYLFCVGADGVYRDVVTHKPELTLFPAEFDPVGLSMTDVLPEEMARRQLHYLEETLQTGDLHTYEQQIQIEGQVRNEEVRVVKSGPDEVLFMVRDVSERAQLEAERKRAEAALIKSEAQNQAILAAIPDLILVFSPDGIYRRLVNPHVGFDSVPPEVDLIGKHVGEVLPVDIAERHLHYLQKAFSTGKLQVFEQRIQVGEAYQDEEVRAIKSGADSVLLMIRDISDRKQAERQLQTLIEGTAATTGQDFFSALVSHIAQALQVDYVLVTEQMGRELQTLGFWANGALQPTYLYGIAHTPCEQVLQAGQFYCPDAVQDSFPKDADLVELQAESYLGVVLTGSKGQVIGHLCILDQQGIQVPQRAEQILRVFAARAASELERQRTTNALEQLNQALEVKVAKRTAALREREQFLQTVLDAFPLSVFWKTRESVYLGSNRNFLQNAGLASVTDLIGKTDHDLPWSKVEATAYQQDDRQVMRSGQAKLGIVETQIQADGRQAWVETNKMPLRDLVGEVIGVLGTYQDITVRQQNEITLQNLIAGTATTGQDFFPALVRHIAEALGVCYAIVNEKVAAELHSLAFWADDRLQPNFHYAIANTPCELMLQIGELYCESGVSDRFPKDSSLVDLDADSYLGVALHDSQGNAIGNLCILDRHPIPNPQRAKQILGVFAARAAAELERQRTRTALEQLNQALEIKVTERTAELWERERFLQTVLDTFPLSVFWKDRNLVYRGGNRNFLKNAGLTSLAELDGKTDYDLPWTAAEAEAYRANELEIITSNQPQLGIIEPQHQANDREVWSETSKLPLHNLEGEVIGLLGTYQDITARKTAEAAMKQQLAAIEAASDGIGILQNGVYIYANQAHLALFGYSQSTDLLGKPWHILCSPEEVPRFEQTIFPVLAQERVWQGEGVATRKDGSTFTEGISLTLTEDDLLICVCRDISEIKQVQAQLSHNALHDPLTGLPNRSLLLERIDLAIQRSQRLQDHQYALLFLDLDRFKVINDSLGHAVGDQLLIEIAQRLKTHLRTIDLVARLGGDEFVILLENIHTTEEVVQIAERILADGRNPFTLDGHDIFTSFSIGIVMGKAQYQQASDLIRDADIAMYRAKAKALNSYKFFDADMHVQVLQRMTLETDLRRALDHQEFTPYYQPIFNLTNQRLVGFEALIRWQHPTQGLIPPDQFIPIAEETGLVVAIDAWMLRQACQQMAIWQDQFAVHFPLKVNVNLSAQDLRKPSLIADIDQILKDTGLSGNLITLEITERMVIADIEQTIAVLAQLQARQINISIDDFGTGYSSLSYLHRLPVHSLKIDSSFVSQMQSDRRNYQIVSTIIALSRQLSLTTVAEGIETVQQLQSLQQLGCQFGQGYLLASPHSVHDIETHFLSQNSALENAN